MTQRDRIVLGVLAVVAVLAGFYMGIVKPNGNDVKDLDAQITAAEMRRDVALADLQTAAAARVQYQRDTATLAVLGKAVPSDDGVPSLLYQLHKAARKAGVTFDSVNLAQGGATTTGATSSTPGTTPGPEGLSALPLTIKFDGTFFELDKFLREVHGFATIGDEKVDVRGRLLTIDSVILAPRDGTSSTLSAEITASAYVSPAESDEAAATGTASGTTSTASGTDAGGSAASGTDSSTTTDSSTGVDQ